MNRNPASTQLLVGDIGGTNARFALYECAGCGRGDGLISTRMTIAARDHSQFHDAVGAFLARAGTDASLLAGASLALACPLGEDEFRFTNSPWCFTRRDLDERLGLRNLTLLNDFEALAIRVPAMQGSDLQTLRGGSVEPRFPMVVLGPGTGLGVAGLVPVVAGGETRWHVVPGEGGHVAFAPVDEFEADLLRHLRATYPRVSVERLVCGDGLVAIHSFLGLRESGAIPPAITAADITRDALSGVDPLAREAVMRFLAMLGSFAGDCAMLYSARGGVYFGGGILPRIRQLIADSPLFERFDAKGRMSSWVSRIPLHLVADDAAALRGAAIAGERALLSTQLESCQSKL